MARGITRGAVYLCKFSAPDKARPVLIVTRNSALPYLTRIIVAPITSTIRGVPTEVVLDVEDGMKNACAVNLDNLITVSKIGIGRWLTDLSPGRLAEVCRALHFAVDC